MGEDAVATVRFVKAAQRLGFRLGEIGDLLHLAAGGPENCDTARETATSKIVELEAKLADLTAMRDALIQLAATCERTPRAGVPASGRDRAGRPTVRSSAGCSDAELFRATEGIELWPVVIRLLAEGRTVPLARVASTAGVPRETVDRLLHEVGEAEWDETGRLIGLGLSLRPTAHRFRVGGQRLYTWCATDTLLFATLLAVPAITESTCPATGRPIRVELEPGLPARVVPPRAAAAIGTRDWQPGLNAQYLAASAS